jgi:hypothetical protein
MFDKFRVSMARMGAAAIIAAAMFLSQTAAKAAVVYSYLGAVIVPPGVDSVGGTVTFNTALPDSLPLSDEAPEAFSFGFSDEPDIFNGPNSFSAFLFSTDSDGNIVQGFFTLIVQGNLFPLLLTTTSDGSVVFCISDTTGICNPNTTPEFASAGTWFSPPPGGIDNLPVSTTPLPTTLPLFVGGLGFVGYLTKRRKKRAQALDA